MIVPGRFRKWLCDKSTGCLLLIALLSCEQDRTQQVIKIPSSNVIPSVMLSELIQIDSVLKIIVNEFEEFGEVRRSFLMENGNVLLHTTSSTGLTLLDPKGNVINQYFPDYLLNDISSVAVVDDIIHILDRESMEIHSFDMKFNSLGKLKLPVLAQSFSVLPNQKLSLYVGNEVTVNKGKLLNYDVESGKILRDELPISDNMRRYFNFINRFTFSTCRNLIDIIR
jgi:hypothetical protein